MANTTIDISSQSSDRSAKLGTDTPWSVFSELMGAVNDAGIQYVVLGDTSQFPNIDGGDIDIAISDGDFPALERVLLNFKGANDIQLVQAIEHEQTSRFYILAWGRPSERPLYIQLDTCSHYFRSGKLLMTADELIENRQLVDFQDTQIYVPNQGSQFVYYIIKKIKKGILSSEHASYLTSTWSSMTSKQKQWASQHFKATSIDDLESVVSDGFSDADTVRLEQRFLAAAKTTFRHKLKEWVRLARRYLNPTGLFVVMMGPDGSGKTTINNLAREYVGTAFWDLLYMHFRPFFGINGDDSDIVEDPHAEPPRSWLASIAKLCYYVFDYIIGYWTKIRLSLGRSGLVIFDRYYQDMEIDQTRYRYGGPLSLLRAMGLFVPSPDILVFLDVNADVIQARKQEVTFEETERQVEAYRTMAGRLTNAVTCDASKPPEDVATCVAWRILDTLAEKTRKRLGGNS